MKHLTSTTSLLVLVGALSLSLLNSSPVAAQQGPPAEPPGQGGGGGGGPGGGGGGGGGGGPPPDRGGGGGGQGDLYADLVMLYRTVDGLPILDDNGCLQPVTPGAIPGVTPVPNPVNNEQVSLIPLVGTGEDACDVQTDYVAFLREVEFGRLAVARSPDRVLARQLRDVQAVLGEAQTISLDAAGRLVADGVEIDSPGQNLAIHQELQNEGGLVSQTQVDITLPTPFVGYDFLDHAAAALGAAADKFGFVGPDLIVYQNAILGIPSETTVLDTIEGGVDDPQGVPGELYVDYIDYSYDRAEKYPGCVTGFFLIGGNAEPFSGSLMYFVFNGVDFIGENVHGFAQAADDSRAVIAFTHDNVITEVDSVGEGDASVDCPDTDTIDPR